MKLQVSFALLALSLFLPFGEAFCRPSSSRPVPSKHGFTGNSRLHASNLPSLLLEEEEEEEQEPAIQTLPPLPIAQWREDIVEAQRRPLTMGARLRLEKEMALLEQLRHSDNALQALLALWVQTRGNEAAKQVVMAQDFLRLPSEAAWRKAESMLVQVIHQEGVAQWTEPVCLLAKLREWQGRMDESQQLYELVLRQKPWHVGALVGMNAVVNAANDGEEDVVQQWRRVQLPPVNSEDDARNTWVDRMVALVQAQLEESHFRRSEWERSTTSNLADANDLDAWQ